MTTVEVGHVEVLGFYDRQRRRAESVCPQTVPILRFCFQTHWQHVLKVRDPLRMHGRARPHGVKGVELFVARGDRPDLPLSQAMYLGTFTKLDLTLETPMGAEGLRATYYARWTALNGDVGPFSLPASI